jgi:hypothetical protein
LWSADETVRTERKTARRICIALWIREERVTVSTLRASEVHCGKCEPSVHVKVQSLSPKFTAGVGKIVGANHNGNEQTRGKPHSVARKMMGASMARGEVKMPETHITQPRLVNSLRCTGLSSSKFSLSQEDAASSKNPLNRLRNFEATIKKEEAMAKDWEKSWGFMKVNSALH